MGVGGFDCGGFGAVICGGALCGRHLMSEVPAQFRAFRIHSDSSGYRAGIERIGLDQLNPGEVVIRAAFSSVNYKDALAGTGQGKILRQFPLVGGIDCAGTVVQSSDARFAIGAQVLVTGCGLSETRDGGYSEYVRLPAEWVVPMPAGLSAREAMIIGTAGFTAALSLWRMQCNGQRPESGPICVTGATGGVGTLAIDIGTQAGFAMHAISAKTEKFDYLQSLGAQSCIDRNSLRFGARPLESTMWAGAIDNVGGMMLGDLSRVMQPWGSIASCGMAGGHEVHTNVMPFIIRGVSILGINSANTPMSIRAELWRRLAQEWRPKHLERIVQQEVRLDGLPAVFHRMLAGQALGRVLVTL
jgi:acrylyl-CoA reductase (NADPH)